MSTRTSDGRRARAPQSPYVPPGARGRASAGSRLDTSPHLQNDLEASGSVPERADEFGRRAGGGGEAGSKHGEGKASGRRPSRRFASDAQQPVPTATARSTEAAIELAEAPPCGQPSKQPPLATSCPLPNNALQGGVGRRDEIRKESEACGDLKPSACLSKNTRKPRQAWSQYVPPGRRGCSSSSRCIEQSQNSEENAARLPSETSTPSAPQLPEGAAVTASEADDSWPASIPADRAPETAVPNATKEASRRRGGRGNEEASAAGSATTVQRESEEAVNVSAATVETATDERPNCDAMPNAHRETSRVARQEDAPLASHGAAAGLPRVPCAPAASHSGCSAGPRRDDLAEAVEGDASDAAAGGAKNQTSVENCAASISEAAATPSSVIAADRTPESSTDEGAGSAESTSTLPLPVGSGGDDVAENCEAPNMFCKRKDGGKTPSGVSAQTELEAGQATPSKEEEGGLGNVAPPDGSICNGAGAKGKDEESQEMPLLKAPFARYVPPGRRKLLDASSTSADGAAGGMGPLWTSRAPVRVSQRPRPSDGEASPARPSPARVAAVVGGGMSAYGANISEYSEHMSRAQVEACTALITNFPAAVPPGQREPMLESFTALGALIVWPRPDEALATFPTPALARQALSFNTILAVELLSQAREEKRKAYQRVELARPGRPPADVSSASRLIFSGLGISRPRARPTGTSAGKSNSTGSSKGRIRGRGAKTAQATESTDSWDL